MLALAALAALEEPRYDLVRMGCMMPVKDGDEATAAGFNAALGRWGVVEAVASPA
jgi:CheY-like chemotaxis protein